MREVDARTGLLPNGACADVIVTEFFVAGAEPTRYCTDAAVVNPFSIPDTPPPRPRSTRDTSNPFRIPPT